MTVRFHIDFTDKVIPGMLILAWHGTAQFLRRYSVPKISRVIYDENRELKHERC